MDEQDGRSDGEEVSGGGKPEEDGSPAGRPPSHKWIALALLAAIAGLAWKTLDPGKIRMVVLLLLAVFGVRIAASPPR